MQKLGGPLVIIGVVAVVIIAAIAGGVYILFGMGGDSSLTPLSSQKNVATFEGLSLNVPPDAVPADFKVGITNVPADDFAQTKVTDADLKAARAVLPSFLKSLSPLYIIKSSGKAPAQMTLSLNTDGLGTLDTVDLYAWDGKEWKFLPSNHNGQRLIAGIGSVPQLVGAFQTATTVQVIATVLQVGDTLGQTGSTVNVVQVSGLHLQADGSLTGGLAGGFTAGQGYAIMPIINTPDDNGATLNGVLADPAALQKQIGGLADLVDNGGYDGVVIDYPNLDPNRGAAFNQFIIDLATALHQKSKVLVVVVPTPRIENAEFTTDGYDLKTLGDAADIIELPLGDDLGAVGSGTDDQMIAWATGEVSRFKMRLVTTTFSADQTSEGAVQRVPGTNALTLFGNANLQTDLAAIAPGAPVAVGLSGKVQSLTYDPGAFTPRFTYLDDGGQTRTVFYVTPETLAHQLVLAQKYNVGGMTVRDLFNNGNPPGMLDAIVQFKLKNAALTTSDAALSFTVNGANGVVFEATAQAGQPFTWTAGDPGQYSIVANLLAGGTSAASLGSVDVAVPSPTPNATNTPGPTATATKRPFFTSTPCAGPCPTATPAPPTSTAAPTQGTVITSGGGAWGTFELGGQAIHGGIPHAADMKRAGMNWVKIQINAVGQDSAGAINNAHAQGFKILISFLQPGGPVLDAGFQQQVANYLGGVAAQGADAIEVWNEANLDRDWPSGQTTGASYTQFLQKSYQAIKAANSNTIVISAAPAPTGYNGGGCNNFCDDLPWLQQFVAAGGLNYTDCLGIHYNEGIVPPTEIGTDPRDNFYSRYYATMVNTYAGAIGNSRPLCFTELGYLTGEGYPDLASTAPGFAWAQHTTIAQQAQWLASAVSIAKGGSAVRMIIVFNMDYTAYGSDPQAGYAIERADGTCPACDALSGVMH
jgi:hypothetical protein